MNSQSSSGYTHRFKRISIKFTSSMNPMDGKPSAVDQKVAENASAEVEEMNEMVSHDHNAVDSTTIKPANANMFEKARKETDNGELFHLIARGTNFKKRPRFTKRELVNQQILKDYDVFFKNGESKFVCRVCRDTFESVKEFYFHLQTHTEERWKAFFAGRNDKVYFSSKAVFGSEMKSRKRSRFSGLLVADDRDHDHVNGNNKVPKTENLLGTKAVDCVEVDKDVRYAAESLVLMSRDHKSVLPEGIIISTDIIKAVEGLLKLANGAATTGEGRRKMVRDFDLNLPATEYDDSTQLIMA